MSNMVIVSETGNVANNGIRMAKGQVEKEGVRVLHLCKMTNMVKGSTMVTGNNAQRP